MNKKTLVWTLIVAVPVGLAALATAYIYRDTGKLPFQEGAETAALPAAGAAGTQAEAPAAAPASTGQDETAQAENTADTAGAASGPSFDVVGVEPTGETVVAGRSDAGAIVALTANGKVVGKSIANEAGEWTIILDEPLKPGDYDVGLEVHDEAGDPVSKSEERLAVSLPEGGKEQPLVVLNTPDGPSDILQKPEPEQQVAAALSQPETQKQANADTTANGTAGANTETAVAQTAENTPSDTAANQQAPATPAEGQVAAAAQDASADPNQTVATAQPAVTADAPASASSTEGTSVASAGNEAPAPAPAPETAADASEALTQTSETQVASAPAAQDTEPTASQTASAQASQTDASTTDTNPAAAPETADSSTASAEGAGTQQQTAAAPATSTAPAGDEPAAEQAPATAAAPAEPTVTVEAVESEQDKVFVAGTGEPGSSVRVYVGDEFQGEAEVNASGKWLVQGTKNIAEGNVEVRADLIAEDGNAVDARAAVTFEKEQDKQIVLTKVVASGASNDAAGQGAEVRKALPVVIIRKGDNLWRISRRLYGEGVRYTTIYQANQDQIRNPDLIYPGQVFLTPEGDLNWKPPAENNG